MTDSAQPAIAFSAAIDSLAAELYKKSSGERFGITWQEFASILCEVGRKYLPAVADEAAARELYLNLRVEELALARACMTRRCTSPGKLPLPANWLTRFTAIFTEQPPAMESAHRSLPRIRGAAHSKAGYGPCWRRST